MRAAFLVDEANFKRYCREVPSDWEIAHFGNKGYDPAALAATGAQAVLIDPMLPLTGETIGKMPGLKIIQSFGVGYNQIDLQAAAAAGIYVCNNAGVNAAAVAEQTVLLMLAVLRSYHEAEAMTYAARQGEYKGRCFAQGLKELGECKVGLVGLGAIGKEAAARLAPFGCQVCYHKPHRLPEPNPWNVTYAELDELLATCDIVSLHLPVQPETVHIMNAETIGRMKPGAILINTSRGELVDQEAVCGALESGALGGFGADTLAPEPVQPDNPIISLPEELRNRVALSPHIGGITAGTFHRSYRSAIANMKKALEGARPDHVVNGLN